MKQLTGLDASFLYAETPNSPQHIAGLSIYDPSSAAGGAVRFKEIIANYGERVRGIPAMTEHLVTVPFQLDHPYWVDDGKFDPEFHIRHIALPKPGDWRQLCILIARLHARPLDRGRPLWEAWVIDGLDNVEGFSAGSFGIFLKTHHAAVDGTSSMEINVAVHDLSPDYTRKADRTNGIVDRTPTAAELVLRSSINSVKKPFHFLGVARNTVPGFAKAAARLYKGNLKRIKDIPRTRFNGTISPYRVFDAVSVSLDDVKRIKNSVEGATVNDAAIAILGGALRKYLLAHDELPQESLAAIVPINVRTDEDEAGGNIVSAMTVQLRTDIEAPMDRLRAVHESTVNAKELANAVGAKVMTDYSQFMPSMLTAQAMRLSSRMGLANRMSPMYNCAITNVPGPSVPLYNTGAKLVNSFSAGPIADGMGLFQVISSYCGQFIISVTSCREMMPDPGFYTECIQESFEELLAAAAPARKPAKKKVTRKIRRVASA